MASIIKRIIRHFNGTDWDKYYPETSADQVKFTKADGTETDIQKELSGVNSTLSNLTITKIMRFNLYLELSAETNSYALFTLSKLNKLFGVSGATAPCFTILVNNADGEAFGSHIDSCAWLNGNTFYITWNEVLSINKNARVYVTVFYTPLANVIKSI